MLSLSSIDGEIEVISESDLEVDSESESNGKR